MTIIFEKINNELSYQFKELKNDKDVIEINSFHTLGKIFEHSYNPIKIITGFEKMLIELEKNKLEKPLYFIDHSNYANLFLIFDDQKKVMDYIQDMCEARGDFIPKNWESALNYLIEDNSYLFKIVKFDIDLNEYKKNFIKQ